MLDHNAATTARLLQTIESEILPLTREGVAKGNKIFGAAILHKSDLSTVICETNNELENPLWHGEMHTLKRFYESDSQTRPDTRDLVFVSTHEPCSLCLSAITWAGFDNFYYLFSHEDSRDAFAIPHDLKILDEVFAVKPGQYRRENEFWKSYGIRQLVASLPETEQQSQQETIDRIVTAYDTLSNSYQSNKDSNSIPLN